MSGDEEQSGGRVAGVENDGWTYGAERMIGDLLRSLRPEALADFRSRRFRAVDVVAENDIRRSAHVVEFVYRALCGPSPARWAQLERVWQIVAYDRRSELVDETPDESPSEIASFAEPSATPAPAPIPPVQPAAVRPIAGRSEASPWGRQPSVESPAAVDETAFLTAIAFDDPLPFQPGAAQTPRQPLEHSADDDAALSGATAMISTDVAATSEAALPFAAAAPMAVERYAELAVRTAGEPPDVKAAIHAELGVADEEHRRHLDKDMARFLGSNSEARTRYEETVARLRQVKG